MWLECPNAIVDFILQLKDQIAWCLIDLIGIKSFSRIINKKPTIGDERRLKQISFSTITQAGQRTYKVITSMVIWLFDDLKIVLYLRSLIWGFDESCAIVYCIT